MLAKAPPMIAPRATPIVGCVALYAQNARAAVNINMVTTNHVEPSAQSSPNEIHGLCAITILRRPGTITTPSRADALALMSFVVIKMRTTVTAADIAAASLALNLRLLLPDIPAWHQPAQCSHRVRAARASGHGGV